MTIPTDGSGAMFDAIVEQYDGLNRLMSLGLDRGWRRAMVRSLAELRPARVLDVATGTGDVAAELRTRYPDAEVVGLDASAKMLARAEGKLAHTRVRLVHGDASALPFDDGSFDAATVAFGLRNFPDRPLGLRQMARVVRPGGLVAVLELTEPQGLLAPLARLYVHRVVPLLGALFSRGPAYAYLSRSIAGFPPPSEVVEMMRGAGLQEIEARPFTGGAVVLFVGRKPR